MTERKIKYLLYVKNPQEFTVDEFLSRGTVGAGWNDLLREMFDKMFDLGWSGELMQVKEKFGGLRVHLASNPDDHLIHDTLWNLVTEYERRSNTICEICGGFPAEIKNLGVWLKTQCDQCFQYSQEKLKK